MTAGLAAFYLLLGILISPWCYLWWRQYRASRAERPAELPYNAVGLASGGPPGAERGSIEDD